MVTQVEKSRSYLKFTRDKLLFVHDTFPLFFLYFYQLPDNCIRWMPMSYIFAEQWKIEEKVDRIGNAIENQRLHSQHLNSLAEKYINIRSEEDRNRRIVQLAMKEHCSEKVSLSS